MLMTDDWWSAWASQLEMKGYLGTLLQVASWCLERSYLELGHKENPFMKRGSDLELPLGFEQHILGWEWWGIEFWFDSQSILWISNWKWCLIGMPGMPSAWNVPFSIRFDVGSSHGVDDVDSSCVASRAQWCFLYSAPTQSVIYNLHIWVYLVYFSLSLSLSLRWLCFPAPEFLAALQ